MRNFGLRSWLKRHHSFLAIGLGMLVLTETAEGEERLTDEGVLLTRVTKTDQSNFKPRLHANSTHLIVGQSATEELLIFRTSDLSQTLRLGGLGKVLDVQISESGWVAACIDSGASALLFSLSETTQVHRVNFEAFPYEAFGYMGCASIRILESRGGPRFLVTNPTNRSFFQMNLQGKIEKMFSPFRGTWTAEYVHHKIFAVVNAGRPLDTMPVVVDYRSNQTIIGDGLGAPEEKLLTTGYFLGVFPDRTSDSVFYIQPTERQVIQLNALDPKIKDFEEKISVTIDYPTALNRYGSCLLAMGTKPGPDGLREPLLWSVLKSDRDGRFSEVAVTSTIEDRWTTGAMRQAILPNGDVFVAGWNGVTRLRDLKSLALCR